MSPRKAALRWMFLRKAKGSDRPGAAVAGGAADVSTGCSMKSPLLAALGVGLAVGLGAGVGAAFTGASTNSAASARTSPDVTNAPHIFGSFGAGFALAFGVSVGSPLME